MPRCSHWAYGSPSGCWQQEAGPYPPSWLQVMQPATRIPRQVWNVLKGTVDVVFPIPYLPYCRIKMMISNILNIQIQRIGRMGRMKISYENTFKGTVPRDFWLQVFFTNQPLSIQLGPFQIFLENSRSSRCITGVTYIGAKWKKSSTRKVFIILFAHLWVVELTYKNIFP